jgi:Ca-activated chloride channel family protein
MRIRTMKLLLVAAVLLVGCPSREPEETEAESGSSNSSSDAPTPDEAFDQLLAEHRQIDDATIELEPEEAYALELAEHGADLTQCGFKAPGVSGSCPKPGSLKGDLKKNVNVVLMLDASGSMQGTVGGRTKISIAKEVLIDFVGTLPKSANVALRVYGHVGSNSKADKPRSCAGTEAVLPLQPLDKPRFRKAIRSFDARGWTPLGRSLRAARGDFAGRSRQTNSNFVYVVSDGIETCGGNPVRQARALNRSNIKVQVNIVGFDVNNAAARQLRRAAKGGGGRYFSATSATELDRIFRTNYNWTKWTEYFNCKYEQATREFNKRYETATEAFNCVYTVATDEFNTIYEGVTDEFNARHEEATAEFNDIVDAARATLENPNTEIAVTELAAERRQSILDNAAAVRQYVVDAARERRQLLIDAAAAHRQGLIDRAFNERADAIERAAQLRERGIDS